MLEIRNRLVARAIVPGSTPSRGGWGGLETRRVRRGGASDGKGWEAVVWIGLPDPCLTRAKLAESADNTADTLNQLIAAWEQYDEWGEGVVVSNVLNRLYPAQREHTPHDDASDAMRAALENAVGCPPGKTPTPRQVGNKLRQFRRRVVGGKYLDASTGKYNRHGAVWKLHGVERPSLFNTCESGESEKGSSK